MGDGACYSPREELANSLSHGLGGIAAVAGLAVMVASTWSSGADVVAPVAVFAFCQILLFTASALYHGLRHPKAKALLRRFDHTAIYLLIAGTYTPVAWIVLGGRRGGVLLVVIWLLAIVGIVSETVVERRRWLSITLYLVMGWLVVVVAGPLMERLDQVESALIIGGGLSYTAGVPFYLWRRLPFGHFVWHLFVIAGSVQHYLAILFAVS